MINLIIIRICIFEKVHGKVEYANSSDFCGAGFFEVINKIKPICQVLNSNPEFTFRLWEYLIVKCLQFGERVRVRIFEKVTFRFIRGWITNCIVKWVELLKGWVYGDLLLSLVALRLRPQMNLKIVPCVDLDTVVWLWFFLVERLIQAMSIFFEDYSVLHELNGALG